MGNACVSLPNDIFVTNEPRFLKLQGLTAGVRGLSLGLCTQTVDNFLRFEGGGERKVLEQQERSRGEMRLITETNAEAPVRPNICQRNHPQITAYCGGLRDFQGNDGQPQPRLNAAQ